MSLLTTFYNHSMDTVTQITLGAAVGEAILGKTMGNRAPLWGAVIGVVPDLDILANPFLSEVDRIIAHRGITHSLLFCAAASPVLGYLLSRLKWNRESGWKSWSWLAFWVILTHILIDACTGYGTQVFQPFSNYALSFNTIFIIDPFYTVPLAAGIVTALFLRRGSRIRVRANQVGLALSSCYLLLGFGLKWQVNAVFEENFTRRAIPVERFMTTPAPLTSFLWTGYAESRDTVYAGMYSVFDDDTHVRLIRVPQRTDLISPFLDDLPIRRLLWFSNGYYSVERKEDGLYFSDLRFGRSDFWLAERQAPFVWRYRLEFNDDSTRVTGFRQFEPSFGERNNSFGALVNRILGE